MPPPSKDCSMDEPKGCHSGVRLAALLTLSSLQLRFAQHIVHFSEKFLRSVRLAYETTVIGNFYHARRLSGLTSRSQRGLGRTSRGKSMQDQILKIFEQFDRTGSPIRQASAQSDARPQAFPPSRNDDRRHRTHAPDQEGSVQTRQTSRQKQNRA
jgi:hypothetical protein